MPKIAITGKGGVGKTTLAALLAHVYAAEGRTVLAIDADPAASLAYALGFPRELADSITPIAEMEELIFERTGAKPGTVGGYFRINPRVDDIPDNLSAEYRGVRLLQLGRSSRAAAAASARKVRCCATWSRICWWRATRW
jgi:CO dehydrogenase maturation factor